MVRPCITPSKLVLAILVAFAVIAAAWLIGFRTEIWADYDSGREREVLRVFGVKIRETPQPPTFLASIQLKGGTVSLNGKSDWHKALSFPFGSERSPDNREATILSMMHECGIEAALLDSEHAAALKKEFLQALAKDDILVARQVVEAAQNVRLKRGDPQGNQ